MLLLPKNKTYVTKITIVAIRSVAVNYSKVTTVISVTFLTTFPTVNNITYVGAINFFTSVESEEH